MFDARFVLPLGQLRPTATAPVGGTGTASTPSGSSVSSVPADVSMAPAATMTATTMASGTATSQPAPGPSMASQLPQLLLMVGAIGVLFLLMGRGQRKAEKARKAMIEQMKRGDKVMTVGGLVARIVSMEDDEVVLKIDESANVKATYKKSSIQQVLDRDEKGK